MITNRSFPRILRPSVGVPQAGATISELFDNFLSGALVPRGNGAVRPQVFVPTLEWIDRGANYLLRAELPGLDAEQVELSLEDDILVLRGEKRSEERNETEQVFMSERAFGSFERRLRLPGPVDAEGIQAGMKNGVLEVVVPKAVEKDAARRIPISS